MEKDITSCQRCGTCCTNGGPALHSADRQRVLDGDLPRTHLITIRAGELVHNPISNRLQPVRRELIKISGVGREWNCFYFDPEEKGCTIYDKRPKACRVLECWDTAAIEEMIEKDTLSRLDLVDSTEPVYRAIQEHELSFPCPDMKMLLQNGPQSAADDLEESANREVVFRTAVSEQYDLSLGEELFYFGRPLFHLFLSVGAQINEVDGRLIVSWPRR